MQARTDVACMHKFMYTYRYVAMFVCVGMCTCARAHRKNAHTKNAQLGIQLQANKSSKLNSEAALSPEAENKTVGFFDTRQVAQ